MLPGENDELRNNYNYGVFSLLFLGWFYFNLVYGGEKRKTKSPNE